MAEINDVLEIVQFIKENAASKQDLIALEVRFDKKIDVVRDEMKEMKNELIGHIDSFTKLYEKLDHELVALQEKYDRHEELLQKLFKRLQLDPKEL